VNSALSLNDLLATVILALTVLIMALVWLSNRNKPKRNLEKIPAYLAMEGLMHQSSEEGRAILLGTGDGLTGQTAALGDSISLSIQQSVLSNSIFNDQPTLSFSGDGALACISQLLVHNAYENAMASELFRPEHSQLSGFSSLAWTAGIIPELGNPKLSSLILSGSLHPEQFLLADLAERRGIPLIVASGSLVSQAAFFASSAPITLGEDYYLPSVGKTAEKNYQNSARA
jgi:hypothetical protein